MKIKYSFQLFARCPVDQEPDVYDVVIESTRTIMCEEIAAAANSIGKSNDHLSQEQITCNLARQFAARVTTTGHHGNVAVEVVAP